MLQQCHNCEDGVYNKHIQYDSPQYVFASYLVKLHLVLQLIHIRLNMYCLNNTITVKICLC